MSKVIRIGTRESQLALWQANKVKELLTQNGEKVELVLIKSEGDTDLTTPLYEMGVQGIFTRSLDIALLSYKIDIAVHSLKDVPTAIPTGLFKVAVLPRASHADVFVPKGENVFLDEGYLPKVIATSSIRRKAQWLNRYPEAQIENLRGNVNTRLQKLKNSNWDGAIFAEAGLQRIGLLPANAQRLEWMLPAPAQGAVTIVCRADHEHVKIACKAINDPITELCTQVERDFLRHLMGGCSTPISALAEIESGQILFRGSILSKDGTQKAEIALNVAMQEAIELGRKAATQLLAEGGQQILEGLNNGR